MLNFTATKTAGTVTPAIRHKLVYGPSQDGTQLCQSTTNTSFSPSQQISSSNFHVRQVSAPITNCFLPNLKSALGAPAPKDAQGVCTTANPRPTSERAARPR